MVPYGEQMMCAGVNRFTPVRCVRARRPPREQAMMGVRVRTRATEGQMIGDWGELRSFTNERYQRHLAEAEESRLAKRAASARPARPAGPSLWQMLGTAVRRVATLRGRATRPAPVFSAR